jgi:hypothetical protein
VSVTDLADFLRARLLERRAIAEAASPGPWSVNAESDEVLAADGITVADGFALSGRQLRATTAHVAANDPAYVLADIDSKLALLDDLLAERHHVNDGDCWYTCPAATDERDGGENCDDNRHGGPCDCGRDERVERRLRLLTQPFARHPEYQEG